MKKKCISAILCMMMVLSLFGCGSTDATTNETAVETKKEAVEIEVTTENWSEYYDFIVQPEVLYNDFNEVDCIATAIYPVLKNELVDRFATDKESSVVFGYTVEYEYRYYEILDAKTGEWQDLGAQNLGTTDPVSSTIKWTNPTDDIREYWNAGIQDGYGKDMYFSVKTSEVTRVEGILYLYE